MLVEVSLNSILFNSSLSLANWVVSFISKVWLLSDMGVMELESNSHYVRVVGVVYEYDSVFGPLGHNKKSIQISQTENERLQYCNINRWINFSSV